MCVLQSLITVFQSMRYVNKVLKEGGQAFTSFDSTLNMSLNLKYAKEVNDCLGENFGIEFCNNYFSIISIFWISMGF